VTLRRLQVTDFRCLQTVVLELDPRFTLICGENASGKTSILESIYVLGRGRSFLTRRLEHLIRFGTTQFVVFGESEAAGRRVPLGVEGSAAGVRARIAGAPVGSLAELATVLPVQIIDPEVHKLIEEGPSRRRRFLDWGVFHVEPGFIGHWQRYHQVLKQRNAGLRARQSKAMVGIWDGDLLNQGELLSETRQRYVERLAAEVSAVGRRLVGKPIALRYRPGWNREMSFAAALEKNWPLDWERGTTQAGPHRAELVVELDGKLARDHISRGQQKLLAAALLIAQLRLFPPDGSVRPTLLLDDPAAELDAAHLGALIDELAGHPNQLIVTTLHEEFAAFGVPGRKYRIHRGEIGAS
jgi:DNA replication and repair protein RecF